jgi:hypothetical protein
MASRVANRQENATKLAIIATFLGGFAAFVSHPPFRQRHSERLALPATDLLLLVMSTFRLGRMVAFDKVMDPLRRPVARTRPDETGAGETVVPRGRGTRRALGELLTCPICAGTWVAAGLVYALHLFPGPARIFMSILGTIGMAEILNAMTENLSWAGQSARKEAGSDEDE